MSKWKEHVTKDTNIMVDHLLFTKEEIDILHKNKVIYFSIATLFIISIIIYACIYIYFLPDKNILFAVTSFFTNPFHIIFTGIGVFYYYKYLRIQKQLTKQMEHLENFRIEMIDHLKNTWYMNKHSSIRDEISAELAKHGINVRYKSL